MDAPITRILAYWGHYYTGFPYLWKLPYRRVVFTRTIVVFTVIAIQLVVFIIMVAIILVRIFVVVIATTVIVLVIVTFLISPYSARVAYAISRHQFCVPLGRFLKPTYKWINGVVASSLRRRLSYGSGLSTCGNYMSYSLIKLFKGGYVGNYMIGDFYRVY